MALFNMLKKPDSAPDLEARLAEARALADQAYIALSEVNLAAEEGRGDAKDAAKARKSYEAAAARVADLESALEGARARQEREDAAARDKAARERRKAQRATLAAWQESARGVDDALDALVDRLAEYRAVTIRVAAFGEKHLEHAALDAHLWAKEIVKFRTAPPSEQGSTGLAGEDNPRLASRTPGPDLIPEAG